MNSGGTLGTLLDTWQLQNYVTAVIDDPATADQAIQALQSAGFGENDIKRWHGDDIVAAKQEHSRGTNVIKQAIDVVKTGLSDEGLAAKDYEEEAKLGHDIVAVRFTERDQLETLRRILTEHQGHHIRATGSLTMEDLS